MHTEIVELFINKNYIDKVELKKVIKSDEPNTDLKKLGIDVVYYFYISRQKGYVFKKAYTTLQQDKKLLIKIDGSKKELYPYFHEYDARSGYTFAIGVKDYLLAVKQATKNDIDFYEILSSVEQKMLNFGKIGIGGQRTCIKKVNKTRKDLVFHLVLLTTLLDYAKKGQNITFKAFNDSHRLMVTTLIDCVRDLMAKGCPFDEILAAFTKKALNIQVGNETLLIELFQIVFFGEYGNIRFAYENKHAIIKFFFEDIRIGLFPLIYDFNAETMNEKCEKRQIMYKEMIEYQKKHRDKILAYYRSRNTARARKEIE